MEIKDFDYKERVYNLFEDIDEGSVKDAIQKIIETNINDYDYISNVSSTIARAGFKINQDDINIPPLTINLSTYGGDIYDGFSLCDSIRTSTTPIKIVAYGKVMSMGIPIILSAPFRAAHKNTIFMIHDIASVSMGTLQRMEEDVQQGKNIQNRIVDYICENSKFPRKKLQQIIEKKQDYFFDAEEALKYKIIDEII